MRFRTISLATLSVVLFGVTSGCTTSTGIVKITDDTYMLGKHVSVGWSGSVLKEELYREANKYCKKTGKN